MEIPDRIAQQLQGESIQSAVNLGDEDLVCFTPTRTLLYKAEGLLSDESVKTFDHDIERLDISQGRRKTKLILEYVDSKKSFSVPKNRGEQVLQRLLAGVLGVADVLDSEESVAGVFLFSELTIVITEKRLVKHVGSSVWDPDFEEYPFSDVTGLEFEEGGHATQIVIAVDGRPERIKAPSKEAKKLRRTLTSVLFSFHDVSSLEELNEAVGDDTEPDEETDKTAALGLDDSISPLVSDSDEEPPDNAEQILDGGPDDSEESEPAHGEGPTLIADPEDEENEQSETEASTAASDQQSQIDPEEIEAMKEQIETLAAAVEQQNEQLESQQETIQQLIKELRRHA